ncbi:uncharacterized protein AMSG_09528 [Thecamonas trahens ATCC 50062]|uniref:RING-type domain-containing protein n=1 Tax=Thecamonas trahens ATCC 50062 TaxID=461836 RepID=A0A0L0DP43_THETB|nr:hypothetical protein AMSG_09528 [Thecamonas trahens ATCC 50062]KNC53806.1 hypothetical protein AMSG_09528 [Thecamonas trahens ATCC 50062]|eukprot:XP_013754364.1 hypothetical protein AMSG_09528 [Thecamonas trahens ATCC 50062]
MLASPVSGMMRLSVRSHELIQTLTLLTVVYLGIHAGFVIGYHESTSATVSSLLSIAGILAIAMCALVYARSSIRRATEPRLKIVLFIGVIGMIYVALSLFFLVRTWFASCDSKSGTTKDASDADANESNNSSHSSSSHQTLEPFACDPMFTWSSVTLLSVLFVAGCVTLAVVHRLRVALVTYHVAFFVAPPSLLDAHGRPNSPPNAAPPCVYASGSDDGSASSCESASAKRSSASDAGDDLCVICFDAPRSAILVPCGHAGVCPACSQRMALVSSARCPLCRSPVDAVVGIVAATAPAPSSRTSYGTVPTRAGGEDDSRTSADAPTSRRPAGRPIAISALLARRCTLCSASHRAALSLPCGHVTTCHGCAATQETCTRCGAQVERTLGVYDV